MLLLASIAAAPAAASAAACTTSISGPNDPNYAPAEKNPAGTTTFNAEEWYFYNCMPQSAPVATDPENASGVSENSAWSTYGFGRSDVIVAYIEGGVNWRQSQSSDIRLRAYLNCGELPAPEKSNGSTVAGTSPGCKEPTKSYDLDGDGVLTVNDYVNDPRVHKPYLNSASGGISAEDLIVAFSDGTDNDHDGYVDDISGWNFHRDTNDPQTDNSVYEHANGESDQLAAQANNSSQGAGLCPNCRLISIKAGDEAIDRPDRVAEAIAFAVDSGAKVIDVTSSSLGHSPAMFGAVQYAYNHGTVVTWASNDFESADHTEGMRLPHVWPGNSIVSDQTQRSGSSSSTDRTAVTFRSRSSLTSFGPHSLFSVPNEDGSTSSGTPTQAGVAAMVISAGLDAAAAHQISTPLNANEVEQVVRATASPINYTPCPTCFPGLPGAEFNIQYGYGRPNLFKAMQAVHGGLIPPTADIQAPEWYSEIDPTETRFLPVQAAVAARRSRSYSWQLQYGLGPQPLNAAFTTIASGNGKQARTISTSFDVSQIPSSFWSGDYSAPTSDRLSIEQYDVTLRLVVTDNRGLVGEDRRVFHLRHNDSEMAGFPKYLGTSMEAGVTMADIEGHGTLDMVVAGSDGSVHAIRPDGSETPGFPVYTNLARGVDPNYPYNYLATRAWKSGQIPLPHDPIAGPLAIGDLDHTGKLEIVVTTLDGYVYVWDGAGRLRTGFPVSTDRSVARQSVPPPNTPDSYNPMTGSFGGPALGDLEGNQNLDIVMSGWDAKIYAWRPDGTAVPGWPVDAADIPPSSIPSGGTYTHDPKIVDTPTLVDIDGDGHPDVMVGLQDTVQGSSIVTTYVTAFSSTGQLMPNFPLQMQTPVQLYGTATDFVTLGVQTPVSFTSPSGPIGIASPELGPLYLIQFDNSNALTQESLSSLPAEGSLQQATPLIHFTSSPSIGNLLGGATPQMVDAGVAATDLVYGLEDTPGQGIKIRSAISAWDATTGSNLSQYTQEVQGLVFFGSPAIADITGDGNPDIVVGTDSAAMHGFDGTSGQPISGWPQWTGGWILTTPAVGDLLGNGTVEVAASTREGYLHVYTTPGLASADHEAWHWHQNDRNTGHYGDDTRPPSAISDLSVTLGGASDTLSFTAVGDDWKSGTAASYQVFAYSSPINQDNLSSAASIPVGNVPQPSGSPELITVPHQAGLNYYAVRAIDAAGNIGPIPVTGTTSPNLLLSPAGGLLFGNVNWGSSSSLTVLVSNYQNQAVSMSSSLAGANAGDFSITGGTCGSTLKPAVSTTSPTNCILTISFSPGTLGTESASLMVSDSPDTTSPHTLTLTAGSIPAVVTPGALTYNAIDTSHSQSKNIVISNISTVPISLGPYAIGGGAAGDYTISGGSCGTMLPGGSSCTINVAFQPTAAGTRNAFISIADTLDPASPRTVSLSGTGFFTTPTPTQTPGSTPTATPTATQLSTATATPTATPGLIVANPDLGEIASYPLSATGAATPVNTIYVTGANSDPLVPEAVAVDASGSIYVGNYYSDGCPAPPGSSEIPGKGGVMVYPAGSNGEATPIASIAGTPCGTDVTALANPIGIAVDSSANIYVANLSGGANGYGSVTSYSAGNNGNVAPVTQIANFNFDGSGGNAGDFTSLDVPTGIALNASGNTYVSNLVGGANGFGSVTVYAAGASGNNLPISMIANPNADGSGGNAGDNTGLAFPNAIAVDSAGKIYVANEFGGANGYGSVTVYAAGANGNVAPTATIGNTNVDSKGGNAGDNTGLISPSAIVVDSAGNIYVASDCGFDCGSIAVFPPGSNGNVAPSATLTGTGSGGLAISPLGP